MPEKRTVERDVLRAALFAADRHRSQRRNDKEASPYINHPLAVAELLTRFGVTDSVALQAALLHDTIEDTETTPEEIEEAFGSDVLGVVLEVTDDKRLPKEERKQRQVQKAPHLSDRAKLVKLADKVCNVTDVGANPPAGWPVERRLAYLDWTEEVVEGCRGANAGLEEHYDEVLERARVRVVEE